MKEPVDDSAETLMALDSGPSTLRLFDARRHEKSGSTHFDLASLPSLKLLDFRVFRGYLIRPLVPFFLRHSLFDILRFPQ